MNHRNHRKGIRIANKNHDINEITLFFYPYYNISAGDKIFTTASQDVFLEELLAWAGGKESFESEIDNRTLNGEVKQVRLICNVVPGYENTLARVLVSIVDLTLQKQMREVIEITAFGRYWTDGHDGWS